MAGPDQIGWRNDLQKLAGKLAVETRVIFTGMLEGDLKQGALAIADAFILPSHQENFGMAVVDDEIFLDEPNISIRWRAVPKILYAEWKGFATSAEFQAALLTFLTGWGLDTRVVIFPHNFLVESNSVLPSLAALSVSPSFLLPTSLRVI